MLVLCTELSDKKLATLEAPSPDGSCPNESEQQLASVNKTVPHGQVEALNKLFECDEHDQTDGGHYIDLTFNPERYTGYRGEAAQRIWRAIYQENCFLSTSNRTPAAAGGNRHDHYGPFSLDSLCYEERMFYRAISGLHASINIHLSAHYLHSSVTDQFAPNLQEFLTRFRGTFL